MNLRPRFSPKESLHGPHKARVLGVVNLDDGADVRAQYFRYVFHRSFTLLEAILALLLPEIDPVNEN